jgi:tRNA pseudouridine55 synthase
VTEQQQSIEKVILVDKPIGWTSFDVVAKLRSQYSKQYNRRVKVGHAGTLDPLASGLLIVLVGKATKRQDSFMKQDKVYQVEMQLGETSSTDDAEGQRTKVSDMRPSEEELNKTIAKFIGQQSQVPPAYSAIKIDGKRAYKLARAGQEVKMKSREVNIYSISDVSYSYPRVSFTTKVSSGTYIRSLVRDIGEELGCGAYMSALRRTSIGEYSLDEPGVVTFSDS